jgi:lipopolysaccharide transport system ATP-binding protein
MRTDGSRASLLTLQVGFVHHLSGRDNAILSGMLLGLSRREMVARMAEIAAFAELEARIDEPVSTYSTGMRARLGFAVAFLADPDILLIDEVLGVGDAEFQQKSRAAMRAKIRSEKTVIVVSHNPSVVQELCDRVVWIHEGVTEFEGDTEEGLAAYTARSAGKASRPPHHAQG